MVTLLTNQDISVTWNNHLWDMFSTIVGVGWNTLLVMFRIPRNWLHTTFQYCIPIYSKHHTIASDHFKQLSSSKQHSGAFFLKNVLIRCLNQWEFKDPKLEVPTIYKAYVRAKSCKGISPQNMSSIVVKNLHFRILKLPLTQGYLWKHPSTFTVKCWKSKDSPLCRAFQKARWLCLNVSSCLLCGSRTLKLWFFKGKNLQYALVFTKYWRVLG